MASDRIQYALSALNADRFRKDAPFTTEMATAHEVLIHHPYATDANRAEALNLWIQRFQPCLFGRVAAALGRIHYCFVGDADLARGEAWIRAKIARERRNWKIRAIDSETSGLTTSHSFILHVASARVAYASPDNALRSLALLIRELWGCSIEPDAEGNDIATETLYLKSPQDSYFKFLANADFFAAQGEGRWWRDHRIPGGFAFTANVTGHMARYREWYERKSDGDRWTLNTAMRTIAGAHPTSWGTATALLPLQDGQPFVKLRCPFELHASLKDQDWTRYRGYYDTDHSVRDEFFHPEPERSAGPEGTAWLQDFGYIYDETSRSHRTLMTGESATAEEIEREVGTPESWRHQTGSLRAGWLGRMAKGAAAAIRQLSGGKLQRSLASCRQWALTNPELDALRN